MKFPNESRTYRQARDELLEAEIRLRKQLETVAALRRALPPGGVANMEYVFDAQEGRVRLSELFVHGDSLVAYSFMYGPDMQRPCPMCTSMLDALEGNAHHIAQRTNLVVIAKSPIERLAAFARERGWSRLRLLSSHANSYNRDYLGESADGAQMPMLNVFRRSGGTVRHFYGSELLYAKAEPGQDPRHVDLVWPLWNVLDLIAEGRGGDWYPKLEY
jgi:predicted dithiol-disulfide oxidoreductase (DUF899 family)